MANTIEDKKNSSRYPYTYACDFIRGMGGYDNKGIKMCRGDASIMIGKIGNILGMEEGELAKKLANYYIENEDAIAEEQSKLFMASFKF
jgi:hypothetical protein